MITLAAITFAVGMLGFSGILLVHVIRNYHKDKEAQLKRIEPLSNVYPYTTSETAAGLITAADDSDSYKESQRRTAV